MSGIIGGAGSKSGVIGQTETTGFGDLLWEISKTSNYNPIEITQSTHSDLFTKKYNTYLLIANGLRYSTGSASLNMKWEYNGSWKDDYYGYHIRDVQVGTSAFETTTYSYQASSIPLSVDSHRSAGYVNDELRMWINRPWELNRQAVNWTMQYVKGGSGNTRWADGVGLQDASSYPITGFQFNANFSSGYWSVFGINSSFHDTMN